MSKIKNFFNLIFNANPLWWFGVMIIAALIGIVGKYNVDAINNYHIYRGVFTHFVDQVTLYGHYPAEYFDMNHYGILFALIIAPFAILPNFVGLLLWVFVGVGLLYYALSKLPIERRYKNFIILIMLPELFLSITYQQFGIALLAMIILTLGYVEQGRNWLATLLIAIGTFVKIYMLGALAFFFFVKRKWSFVGWFALWCVVLFLLPMLFSSPQYVIDQYVDWGAAISAKSGSNMFSAFQNISLLGFVRKITGCATYSDMWIMGAGLLLFFTPYCRRAQYKNSAFRLMFLSSVLMFLVLFSSGSESCSYLMSIIAVGLWWAVTPYGHTTVAYLLLGLCVAASLAINLLPSEFYHEIFRLYALKSLPFTFVWLRILYEMVRCDYSSVSVNDVDSGDGHCTVGLGTIKK